MILARIVRVALLPCWLAACGAVHVSSGPSPVPLEGPQDHSAGGASLEVAGDRLHAKAGSGPGVRLRKVAG